MKPLLALAVSVLLLPVLRPIAPDRGEMLAALGAAGPHPSLGQEAELFDRFVGTWDVAYSALTPAGTWQRFSGELRFGWILDGHAQQDIWISFGSGGARTAGTSVRFYDVKRKVWRVVWIAPTFQTVTLLEGGAEEDRIVLRGADADGSLLRWSFQDIRADAFLWRGERSRDGGTTWRLEEENHMRRR